MSTPLMVKGDRLWLLMIMRKIVMIIIIIINRIFIRILIIIIVITIISSSISWSSKNIIITALNIIILIHIIIFILIINYHIQNFFYCKLHQMSQSSHRKHSNNDNMQLPASIIMFITTFGTIHNHPSWRFQTFSYEIFNIIITFHH
jgi:hypothetical protein